MSRRALESCYMCGEPATSREHAPAKALFPEGRRVNLISVPSCDAHNSHTSEDDEHLRTVLVMGTSHVSAVGRSLFEPGVLGGARRSPAKYRSYFNKDSVDPATGNYLLKVDTSRVLAAVEKTIRAICFHEFRRKWTAPIHIVSSQILADQGNGVASIPEHWRTLITAIKDSLSAESSKGANPEVFQYRILVEDERLVFGCIFYEAFEFWAVSLPEMRE